MQINTYNPVFNAAYDEIVKKLDICGVVPLVHIEDKRNALPLAGALMSADITAAEITFRTSCADEVIRTLSSRCPRLAVGAGTVINVKQVQAAVAAGAKYIVTPAFNPDVVDRCIEMGIPVFPGCSTATDIDQAYSRGLRVVKFFPSELLGGVRMLKALGGPYPFMKFIPTGGINLNNLTDYLSCNQVLCCAGTFIAGRENLDAQNFAEITRIARAAVDEVLSLRLEGISVPASDDQNASDVMKSISRLAGINHDKNEKSVFGMSATVTSDKTLRGTVVYSSPNLERCLYYLGNRGFPEDKVKTVKEGSRLTEITLVERIGHFEIKIIKR